MLPVPVHCSGRHVQERMEWFLTVLPLLPMFLLATKLPAGKLKTKAWTMGLGSALVIVSGYYNELVVTGREGSPGSRHQKTTGA